MLDQYDRSIHYLRLSVTDRCNLRCAYCMPEQGIEKRTHSEILSFEAYVKIVRAAASLGVHKVRITGGEPLVRKNIVSLVEQLKQIPEITSLNMTTNGVLLKTYAKSLRDAGLDRVNISLDSLDPDRYREITRGGELKTVLEGIDAALEVGFPLIKINAVLIGGLNTDELSAFMALSSPRIEVRFIELMPIGEASNWAKDRFVSAEDWLLGAGGLVPVAHEASDGPARYFKHPVHGGRVGIINPVSSHFCTSCNRVRVTADGKLKNCLHSDTEIDLSAALDDPDELIRIMAEGIESKPLTHLMNDRSFVPVKRDMNKIGG